MRSKLFKKFSQTTVIIEPNFNVSNNAQVPSLLYINNVEGMPSQHELTTILSIHTYTLLSTPSYTFLPINLMYWYKENLFHLKFENNMIFIPDFYMQIIG